MTSLDEVLAEQVRDIIRKECREQLDTAFRAGNQVSLAALDEKIDMLGKEVSILRDAVHLNHESSGCLRAVMDNHADALVELQRAVTDLQTVAPAAATGGAALAGVPPTHTGYATYEVRVAPGYECLFSVLVAALDQAQSGKGAERHGNSLPFDQQPMQTVADATGSIDGILFQMMKKARESTNMPLDRAVRELLGSIVYAAGAVIWRQRHEQG